MGGLRKYMPITNITFLIAALSISGFPLTAGFFSKDEILAAAFEHNKAIYFITLFVAGLTAFYMFRLYFSIFWGKKKEYEHTPHESPWSMAFPLVFLAFMSIAAGYLPFSEWVTADRKGFEAHFNITGAAIAVTVGLIGIAMAWFFYKKPTDYPAKISAAFGRFYKWTFNKFYIDELYLFITRQIIFKRIAGSFAWFDQTVVDGSMRGIGNKTVSFSKLIKGLQSGKLQDYAVAFAGGAFILVLIVLYVL
jgi:NADH-quinone oxidoreductase subunit L